jgi:threonine dehydrogenase-like Zn-dependent dehydrogenase
VSAGNGRGSVWGATMRAAVIAAPHSIEIREVQVPRPASDQILVRIEGCGICASTLPLWQGRPWFTYPQEPGAPGHEAWGQVAAVGRDVHGYREGDRVAVLSSHAHAEYDVAAAAATLPIPDALASRPFPGEPLGCAINIFERSMIAPGHTVAIVGIGFLGAVLTGLSVARGARVIAVSRRPFARDTARALGAEACLEWSDAADVKQAVEELTAGSLCERVIEAVGSQAALDVASAVTAERGRLVIAGYHQDGPRTVDMQQWNWRGIDVVNAHERAPERYLHGMRAAIGSVLDGSIASDQLLTHRLPLDRLALGLELADSRPDGFLKAYVVP